MKWTEDQMLAIGGKLWCKGDKRRVYVDDWAKLVGLEIQTYNTGNISYAALDGEKISNSLAYKLGLVLYWEGGRLYAQNFKQNAWDRVRVDFWERLDQGITTALAEADAKKEES